MLLKVFKNKHIANFKSPLFFIQNCFHFSDKLKSEEKITQGLNKTGSEEEQRVGFFEKKFKENFLSKEELLKRKEFLKREMTSNPEFFKAFPHLAEKVKTDVLEDPSNEINVRENYRISEKDLDSDLVAKKQNYFESLLNKHKGYDNIGKSAEDKELANRNMFVDAYGTREGPMKYMSREEKENVHSEIDLKMDELEETGLSREELLYNRPEGLPLAQDKFFQFLKKNKVAREMLVKPNEHFTADLVIEKALKQDIGPDGSLALPKRQMRLAEDLPMNYSISKINEIQKPTTKNMAIEEQDYDYKYNYIDKLKLQLNTEKLRPTSFVNPPLMRAQIRKKYMIRTIRKKDINWKNIPLLIKFLNPGGKLMNKFQTRLPTNIHRRLSKTVKHARNMGLLPFIDIIKPFHKLPLTSMYTDFVNETSKVVDKKTGLIKVVHLPSEKDKFSYSNYDLASQANKSALDRIDAEKFKDSLKLDQLEIPSVPSLEQRELILAQNYLITLKENNPSQEETQLGKQQKEAYEKYSQLFDKTLSATTAIESFINEKGYNIQGIKANRKFFLDLSKEVESNRDIKQNIINTKKSIEDLQKKYSVKEDLTRKEKILTNIEPQTIQDKKNIKFKIYDFE